MKVFPFLTPILLAPLITAHAQQEPALLSDPPDGSEAPVPKVRAVFKPCVVEETTVTRQGGRDIIVQRLALDPNDPNDPINPVVPESPAAIPFDPAAAADFPEAPPAYLLFLSATENPWRFWTNDDDDSGETGGTDIPQTPGTEDTNGYDHRVNKMRDLIDFFPVDLDLKAALAIFLEGKYRYRLSHSAPQLAPCFKIDQALDLHVANSDAYMRDLLVATSTKTLVSAPIHAHGRNLDSRFLAAQAQSNGLLLIEGIRPITVPIQLSIIRKLDQAVVGEVEWPVSITSVMAMHRWKFVSPGAQDLSPGDIPSDPPNWPDADRNGKHFVFVHGYNVNPEQSKGWGAEAFKRMFWSGSNARFSTFAWFGYESQTWSFLPLISGVTPNYQVNLLTASEPRSPSSNILTLSMQRQPSPPTAWATS